MLIVLFALLAKPVAISDAQSSSRDELRLFHVRTSLLGSHYWYQQTYRGVDVLNGFLVRHIHNSGDVVTKDNRRAIGRDLNVTPAVTKETAERVAGPFLLRSYLAIQASPEPRLVWVIITEPPTGTLRTLVDAHSGQVISVERIARDISGSGRVFDPNPVVTLRNLNLTDQNNADYPALAPAYRTVALTRLDGSGFLRGEFARLINFDAVFSSDNNFLFDRSAAFFEQTMAYYHITFAQEYLQTLGFTGPTSIDATPQQVFTDAFPDDNSFFSPESGIIFYGAGGVDDAEDADVIIHEYGHALQNDQVPGFGFGLDAQTIGEGFSDYWAVTVTQPATAGWDVPCFADWDTVPNCSRRTDTNLTVDDRTNEPHFDGQIWSRALWDINQALGRDIANVIILEAQFNFSPSTTLNEAALATVDTAQRLFGHHVGRVVEQAFADRKIILTTKVPGRPPVGPPAAPGLREVARLDSAAPGGGIYVDAFEPYALDDRANALYASDVSTGGQAVFVGGPGGFQQVVRSGDPAPGGGVFGLGVLAGPGFNSTEEVAVSYLLAPLVRPFGRNAGVYRWSRGNARAVVVPGLTPAPTGGTFVGSSELPSINDSAALAFSGMIQTTQGISGALGMGVFVQSSQGTIATVAAPGTVVPDGTLDYAAQPAINNPGDVAFGGHLAGTPCRSTIPQNILIGCVKDLFMRNARTNAIDHLVRVGDAAPGGGVYRDIQYPVINGRGDILFRAVLDTDDGLATGYFLRRDGVIIAIARTGYPMPGGGNFTNAAFQPGNWDLNDRGDVSFSVSLDTFDSLGGIFGVSDQGVYQWSNGVLSLVVRSGMSVPAGEIVALQPLGLLGIASPFSGAQINNSRQVLFQVTVLNQQGELNTVLYVQE